MKARGKFITVEGIEGTGKSTNIDFVTGLIESRGIDVLRTREPGGTPMAEKIRQLLLDHGQEPVPDIAELLLFFAARSLHLRNTIVPALERGEWVICDRFTDATYAYQGGGRGIDSGRIRVLEDWLQQGFQPDMTLLFDLPVELGLKRAGKRGALDRFEQEQSAFFEQVREAYLQRAGQAAQRFRIIDAGQDLATVQQQLDHVIDELITASAALTP